MVDLRTPRLDLGRGLRGHGASDELVCRRFGVAGRPGAGLGRNSARHRDLRLLDLEATPQPVRDDIARALEEVLHSLAREETEMGLVEEPLLAVAEGASEERQAHA